MNHVVAARRGQAVAVPQPGEGGSRERHRAERGERTQRVGPPPGRAGQQRELGCSGVGVVAGPVTIGIGGAGHEAAHVRPDAAGHRSSQLLGH